MRVRVTILAVVLLALAIPAGVQTASGWKTEGHGGIAGTSEEWKWSAKSDVGGGNPEGYFRSRDHTTGFAFEGDVTCLSVVGMTARIGIVITESTNPARPVGQTTFIVMSTTDDKYPLDLVGADANLGPIPILVCPPPSGQQEFFDGKIKVEDA